MASFYDSASIITIPSGYKAGTLYSAKPTDGTGDMTFTRTGDTATRVNSAGIIERCITNSALQSNNFSNASWTKSNVNIAGSIADPNGGTTAFSMAGSSSTSNAKNIAQAIFSSTSDVKTFSIYAKANTHSFIQVKLQSAGVHVNFDLTTGTLSNGASAVGTITSIGGGWYRCQMTTTAASTNTVGAVQLVDSLSAANNESSTTTNSVYIWRAQAQTGDLATNYIDTTTAAVTEGPVTNLPRLDYFGSTCPQLLMEPTRTNLIPYSQMLNTSTWQKLTGGVSFAPVVTANMGISPDGYQNADLIVFDLNGGTSSNDISTLQITPQLVSGTVYAWSFYAKTSDGTNKIVNTVDSSGLGQLITITPNWQRFTKIFTATVTGGGGGCRIRIRGNEATSSSASVYIWGAQCEAGAYATSYIPTTAATVTRNEDYCRKTSISSLIGQTEGTLFIHFRYNKNLDSFINIGDGTSGNRITIGSQIANNTARAFISNGGSTQTDIVSSTNSLVVGNYYKMAVAYKQNDIAFYLNGSLVATDTTATIPAVSNLYYGGTGSTALFVEPIVQVLLFKTRLSNTDLATLTTL